MTDRDFNFVEHINYEALIQLDNRIEETQASIKKLEDKKAQLQSSEGGESELFEIEKDLHDENIRLDNLRKDRKAMLGYLG